jgi:uncharacterized membrane protein YedE/YeeE
MSTHLRLLGMGALLGFSLSRIGFTSWDEVHAMFTFASWRMFLAFALGVSLLTAAFAVIQRRSKPAWPARPIQRGTLLGGVLFGLGWALSGACPGVTLAQLGEGRFYALFVLLGVGIGNAAYGALLERRFTSARAPAAASATTS